MNYHNITHEDMLNGDGLRVVLWVAGCDHHCPNCQNPITWDADGGIPFDEKAIAEVMDELDKPHTSGITFSGGDPLHSCNIDTVKELARQVKLRFPDKTLWLYTGFCWGEIKEMPVVQMMDVVVDGPYVEAMRDTSLYWRGSSNQRVIDVQKSLETGAVVLWCE